MLEYNNFYHIYNRGNNKENIFISPNHYEHFLNLIDKYIVPVAEIFAWGLMKNHFHIVVKIKAEEEIWGYKLNISDKLKDPVKYEKEKWETISKDKIQNLLTFEESDSVLTKKLKKPDPMYHFSHFFNAYARYFNKSTGRIGLLFQQSFNHNIVNSDDYLRNLIVYIHSNPVIHKLSGSIYEYKWTSLETILSDKTTSLERDKVISLFDGIDNFIERLNQKEIICFEEWEDE